MALAAGIFAAVGALVEGRQESREARMAAKAEKYQRDIALNNAAAVGQQTSARIEEQRREAKQILGTQRAGIAESGTAFSGSNSDVIRQSTINAELDALNIGYGGEMERTGLLNEAAAHDYNRRIHKYRGKQAMQLRWFKAAAAGMSAYGGAGGGGGSGGGGGGGS